jgi:pimeloyl-ACP methyl ester carboxylesterase
MTPLGAVREVPITMYRRSFLGAAAGLLTSGAFACTSHPLAGPVGLGSPLDAAAFHRSRQFAATLFGRIAYVERGTGPAALFLHGLPLNGFHWRGALDRLSGIRRCVAPDLMGLGYTEVADGQRLAPEAQAEMCAALLDTLGITAVDLVANDSGGAVAQIFVARFPARVRTLMLTNCDVHDDSPPPPLLPLIAAARAGTFADDDLAPQLADKAIGRAKLGNIAYTDPARLADETIDCYLAPLLSSPRRMAQLHAYIVALERNPLRAIEPALQRCDVPLRVVWGTGDTIFDPSGPDWLHRTFRRSLGVRRLEGAKAFFPEEMPDVIADEARRLWRSVG